MAIQFKRNSTNTPRAPLTGTMAPGELALDIAGRKLYTSDNAGQIISIGNPDVRGGLEGSAEQGFVSGFGLLHPDMSGANPTKNVINPYDHLDNVKDSGIYYIYNSLTNTNTGRPVMRGLNGSNPNMALMKNGYLHVVKYPHDNAMHQIYYTAGYWDSGNFTEYAEMFVRYFHPYARFWGPWYGCKMELSNTIPSNGGNGSGRLDNLSVGGGVHSVSGTFTEVGETIMAWTTGGNGGGGYRIGVSGYINGYQVVRQGHGDTYGVGGGAAITIGGAPGLSWTVAKNSWSPDQYSFQVFRVVPGL